jgi:TRL-like protein family
MKKSMLLMLALVVVFSGCAVYPLTGALYTNGVKSPIAATSNEVGMRMGSARARSIFGIAFGDASIQQAAINADIKKIATVDYKVWNLLGIFVETTTIVTGS